MKKKWKQRVISILLCVCMLTTVAPATQMNQVEASFDILSFVEKAGAVVRGGKTAYEKAKNEKWNPGKAFLGTFKCIGQELMGLGDDSPGSTVIVNQVDLSQVENQLAGIQDTLKSQSITLNNLEKQMKDNTDALAKQISDLSSKIDQNDQKKSYENYLNGYFKFYNEFCEAMGRSESTLNTMYTGNPSQKAIKNGYDRVYQLVGTQYTGDYRSAVDTLGKYIRGEYQSTNPGSLIDILCKYYKLAGYNDTEIAEAIKEFVAQTYYAYWLANYYYMAVTLYQYTYMENSDLQDYDTDFSIVLSKSEIEENSQKMLENNMKTTMQIFYDLNKHFCSVESQRVLYSGTAGTADRVTQNSQMDVEPGSSVTLADSTQILDAYFGKDYSKMFGDICSYSYEVNSDGVQIEGNKLSFDKNLAEGKDIKVDMYCTISDQSMKLHTYTFTCKKGKLSGGYGTAEYPYVIRNLNDYDTFSRDESFAEARVSLETDLDFGGTLFNPVSYEFKGQFYGNGYKISNTSSDYLSLYGMFSNLSGVVQDLTIENADVSPSGKKSDVGILADVVNRNGRIERCEVINSRIMYTPGTSGTVCVGGIAGKVSGGSLKGCIVRNVMMSIGDANVKGQVGGLVGYMDSSATMSYCGREEGELISLCKNTESPGSYLGGLVGLVYGSTINNCWSYKTGSDHTDFASSLQRGSFVGICSNLKSSNCVVYSGDDAEQQNLDKTYAKVEGGDTPQVREEKDFDLSKTNLDGTGYLTNAESSGKPIRLKPIEMEVRTDDVKTAYYYGEYLELNGLSVRLKRGDVSLLGYGLYNVDTDYNGTETGKYTVKVNVGNLIDSFRVTVANKPHIYEQQIVREATCTEEGITAYKCTEEGCDAVLSSDTIPALGHKMEHHEKVEADYDNNGVKEYWHCTVCSKNFLDEKGETEATDEELVIPMLRHEMEHHDKKVATSTKDGNIEYWHCTICDKNFLDEKGKQEIENGAEVIAKASNIKLNTVTYIYDSKVKKPSVTVKTSKGKALAKADYSVTYAGGCKNAGSYTVTITLKNNYSGTMKKTFTIVPKTTSISKVTAGKKKMTVKWKKQATQTSGYQLQYGTASSFKGAKTSTIIKNKTVSKSISKLKAKKKYYVRIRTYKTVKVNGKSKKLYSAWSKAKSVKVK